MGYETVDPATLQALLGSPPVATYGDPAVPVATQGGSTEPQGQRPMYSPARPAGYEPYKPLPMEEDVRLDAFHKLIASLGNNLAHSDFGSAMRDIQNLDRHLNMGIDHWERFVSGEVD